MARFFTKLFGKDDDGGAKLEPLIGPHRDRFLGLLVRSVESIKARIPRTAAEFLVAKGGAEPPFNLGRIDILSKGPNDKISAACVAPDNWDAAGAPRRHFSGLALDIAPFAWTRCELAFDGDPIRVQPTLVDWTVRHIDPEDELAEGPNGLQGVIHYLHPRVDGRSYVVSVDFGSSPADTLDGLLAALANVGVSAVRIREGEDETPR